MNKVTLLGLISQEPTIKEFPEKNLVRAKFSIAVNDFRNYNQSYFFNCVGWNQIADYVSSNLHKGDFVAIDGRITNRSYINEFGAKAYITEIIVDNIRNLGTRKSNNETKTLSPTNETKQLNENVGSDEIIDLGNLINESASKHQIDEEQHDNDHDDIDDDDDDIDWD